MRPLAALLLAPLLGCFMTADPDRWKEAGADDRAVDHAPIELGTDGPAADNPVADTTADGPQVDLPAVDGPGADGSPDLSPLDLPPPDLPPPDMSKTMVLVLASAVDDGEICREYGPNPWLPNGEGGELYMGHGNTDPTWGFHRFALSQAIPQGAVISQATLELYGVTTWNWSPGEALEIRAEQAADAQVVTSEADEPFQPKGRTVTLATVRWPASGGLAWTINGYNSSTNLASVLQDVVNTQGGLAQGAHVQLWVRGAQTSVGEVASPAYGTPGFKPARLTISWTP